MQQNGQMSLNGSKALNNPDRIGIIAVAAMSFLPLVGIGNYLRLVMVVGLFFLQGATGRFKLHPEIKRIITMMITGAIVPALVVTMFEGEINFGFWSHEFIRILFLSVLIAVVYNYKTSPEFLLKVCIVVLCVNFVIQFMQWRGLGGINGWIQAHYLNPEDKKNVHLLLSMYEGAGFRAGSIFINPNVCMVIPCTVIAVLLQHNIQHPNLINYAWIGVALFSVLLTGSRTAFILSMVIVGYCTWKDKQAGKIKWLLPIVLILGLFYFKNSLANFRAFDLENAMASSGNTKLASIFWYVSSANIIYLLTGCCGSANVFGADNEWVYIFMFYGVIGIWWYISLIKLFKRNQFLFPFQSRAITCVLCLIACSATVMLCMPVCSFFCLVALTKLIPEK